MSTLHIEQNTYCPQFILAWRYTNMTKYCFQIVQGGHMVKIKKSLLLMMILMLAAAATLAQKKSAKASQTAATPNKEITDADVVRVSVDELILMMTKKKPVLIIDVRGKGGYTEKIKGAVQIPLDEIEARMKEIPRNKEIITYCS
jgi:hypothetical protein